MSKNRTGRDETAQSVDIGRITGSKWNTHRAAEDDAAIDGLAESIDHNGMIHRIAVRTTAEGTYEVIDGHRRLEAAKKLGWTTVPCEIHEGMSDETAQEMTLSANIQRIANDALLEAGCIRMLSEAGRTYEQIAAVLGSDARYVARRARLIALTDEWRGWFERNRPEAVDTMELVASHERDVQNEVYEEEAKHDVLLDHHDIERAFERHKREIGKDTKFDTAYCAKCQYNTATHGLLFGSDEPGKCQKPGCYATKWNVATDAKIEALRKRKVEVREAKTKWQIPNSWYATKNKTKKNTEAWVYTEGDLKSLVWTEPRVETKVDADEAMTEEEKSVAKMVKRLHNAWKKSRRTATDKIRERLKDDDGRKRIVEEVVSSETFLKIMADRFRNGVETWTSDGDCLLVHACIGTDGLAKNGIDLTQDERQAIEGEDPEITAAKKTEDEGEES